MCVTTVDMLMFLRDFGPYGIVFVTVCVFTTSDIKVVLDGHFTASYVVMSAC
jgi:hypothetical protein